MKHPRPLAPKAQVGEFSPGRKLSAVSMDVHRTPDRRSALRCGLHDATIIADQVARNVEIAHTRRGRLTKKGVEMHALAKQIADAIWTVYNEIDVAPPEASR